jgi:PAS domain S-box-containing protein
MSSTPNRPSWNPVNLNSPFRIAILACLVAIMSYFAARLGTTVVIRDTMEWPLWPGNILLVCTLLYLPRRIWPIVIGAALVTFAFYDLRLGISIRSIIFYQLSDIAEVLTAALGISYCFGGVPQLDSVKALAKFSFFAVLLAPLAGASLSAPTTHGDYWRGWRIIFLSQALGYLTLIPAILRWVSKRSEWAHASLSRYLEAAVLLAGLAVLGYFSFVSPSTIIVPVLTIVPFFLWSALRFGTTGVSSVAIAVAFLAIWGAVQGRGPFVGQESANNVPSIQVFLLFVAAPFMVLAVVVEEHTQSQLALRQSEDKLRLLLDSTGEGIYGVDLEERCTFCNPACIRALGYGGVDELLGKNMHDLIHYARVDGTLYPVEECRNFRAVRAGQGIHVDDEVLWRADGTSFPAELWSYPQRRGQEVVGAVVAFIDITERKLAEDALASAEQERERLRQLEADLAHTNRVSTLGEMAASLAHEIKQPIAAAITSAHSCIEWLAHEPPNLDRARAAAAKIDKYGNRAAEIIDHIRSLYKNSPPQRELVDVDGLIKEMITLLKDEATQSSIAMRTELAAKLPEIKADRVQLQQVFMNLMLNAIEAMEDSGGELMVKSQLQDGQLQFSVSDTGVGLPMEKMDQIFSAFFTTKPQGSGMGLAISRSIVESHGGQLWATANDGRGATFYFTLPTAGETVQAPATGR